MKGKDSPHKFFTIIGRSQKPDTLPVAGNTAPKTTVKNSPLPEMNAETLARCSNPDARKKISYEQAVRLKSLPLALLQPRNKAPGLTIATAESMYGDQELLSSLRFATDCEIRAVSVPDTILLDAIFIAYHGDDQRLVHRIAKIQEEDSLSLPDPFESLPEFHPDHGEAGKFIADLVDYAISHQASDIHITPMNKGCGVRLRIDGKLFRHDQPICSLKMHEKIISRLKVLAGLDTTIRERPQDGSITVPTPHRNVGLRLSLMPTISGEKAVLRIIGGRGVVPFDELGLNDKTASVIYQNFKRLQGAILFSGPTGSGKSTTMYGVLHELSKQDLNLVSIEDPVEQYLEKVSQTSIHPARGLDYPTCLKAVLRQDPDVILLGEIRDPDSATQAFQAALTGHLLLSTVHARNVFEVFLRLQNLGVDLFTVTQSVSLLVSQRLIPALCTSCRTEDPVASARYPFPSYHSPGCTFCDYSGVQGRVLATETLILDNHIRKELLEGSKNFSALPKLCTPENYHSLESDLIRLIKDKKIAAPVDDE